ncbi:hypothetical protein AX17_001949 [Amanita inopinata Kibby_2008]|nr:hypothetical protein AX17_001949 [Amanita inopinata Kibby_2008]
MNQLSLSLCLALLDAQQDSQSPPGGSAVGIVSVMGDPTSFSYTDFVTVKQRKRRKHKVRERPSAVVLLQQTRAKLVQDEWFAQCQKILDESIGDMSLSFSDVICLGLGSPSSSLNSRVQLAFLLEICDYLMIDRPRVSVYDPVFTPEDLSLLQGLQVTVLSDNRNGLYSIDAPTIVFMPHCDMELYENMLKANWKPGPQALSLLIIANQLSDYIDKNLFRILDTKVPYLLQIEPGFAYLLLLANCFQ